MKYYSLLLLVFVSLVSTESLSGSLAEKSMIPFRKTDAEIEQSCIYDLTVGAVFQNEARFLREWVEYHLLLGVQHFILFNDRSTDNFRQVLQPYLDMGVLELYDAPCPLYSDGTQWTAFQQRIVSTLFQMTRGVSRWVASIDIDEFLVPMHTDNIVEFLAPYEGYAEVYIRWELFGTSWVKRVPDDKFMIETLVRRMPFAHAHPFILGKQIAKPHRIAWPRVHLSGPIDGYLSYDINPAMIYEFPVAKIFHYWCRDDDFLVNEKLPRKAKFWGTPFSEEEVQAYRKLYNEVEDLTMERFIPELRSRIFGTP